MPSASPTNRTASESIYLLKDGQKVGPFSAAQIQDQMAQGLIDTSVHARLVEGGKWQPLVKILYNPESSLRAQGKIKRLWEKIQLVLTVAAVIVGAIYILIVNAASWLEEQDSLTAFLALAALWSLWSLPLVLRKIPKRPGDGWLTWTMIIFALGAFACLSHLNVLQYHRATAFGAVASIVILVFACREFAKRQREEKEKERQRDPLFQENEEAREKHLREERKREFIELTKECGVLRTDKNEQQH